MPELSGSGLGTRKLVSIGLQQKVVPKGAILLLDEVEAGLEPHRLRRLLRTLRARAARR